MKQFVYLTFLPGCDKKRVEIRMDRTKYQKAVRKDVIAWTATVEL